MAEVILKNLVKEYTGDSRIPFRAVKSINLEIRDREFMVLVGPSGCGKSTTLRMIAGLEEVTDGEILIGDRVVNNVQPKDRDISMVFQNYALYPHMTVYNNISFGLKLRRMPKAQIQERVFEAAEILGIQDMLLRKPKALSGGQRQRVALGRAIVRKPSVFLFDEPLSNLDAKMRVQMRTEISKLHERLDSTMIYVTHDQVEAMTMGDRICVMKDGDIQQVDRPIHLYNNPANVFVGSFIGSPPMNFFNGRIQSDTGSLYFVENNKEEKGFRLKLDRRLSQIAESKHAVGKPIIMGVRPEHIQDADLAIEPREDFTIETNLDVSEPMGSETFLYLRTLDHSFVSKVPSEKEYGANSKVKVQFDLKKAHLFDAETEENLIKFEA